MKNLIATAALAAALSAGTFATASAMPVSAAAPTAQPVKTVQYGGERFRPDARHVLPKHVIIRSLHHRGYTHIRDIRRVRGDYVVQARGHRGPVRLLVDGRTSRILERHVMRGGWDGKSPNRAPRHFNPSFGMY